VLDRYDEPVPIGVRGALCIGGAGVGRGYWHRPELSAASFVPDPFSGKSGTRMYRSGDLALRRADGNLEFCGRSDRQIKIRGIRIELGEVEAALTQHPEVTDVAVVVGDEGTDDRRLVAYFVAGREPAPDAHELREFLKSILPGSMIPAAFVRLARLPLTPNGKVDRLRLPLPDGQSLAVDPRFVAPRSDVEIRLAAIFAEALAVDRIGVHDDFFALGGHSLLAMRVLATVKTAFNATISPRAFFGNATIAGLARGLTGADEPPGGPCGGDDRWNPRESPIRRHPRSARGARKRRDAT
jgi:acyl carrier protein